MPGAWSAGRAFYSLRPLVRIQPILNAEHRYPNTGRMYPHRIRLVGPWEAEPIAWFDPGGDRRWRTDDLPPARRAAVPVRWEEFGFPHTAGVVLFRRKFGLPRRLDEWERVWLAPARNRDSRYRWQLNRVNLPWDAWRHEEPCVYSVPPRVDITAMLTDRNELTARIVRSGAGSEPFGGAALEIGCRAYVRHVRVVPHRTAEGCELLVDVRVVSENADDPLELYARIEGVTLAYYRPAPPLEGDDASTARRPDRLPHRRRQPAGRSGKRRDHLGYDRNPRCHGRPRIENPRRTRVRRFF